MDCENCKQGLRESKGKEKVSTLSMRYDSNERYDLHGPWVLYFHC